MMIHPEYGTKCVCVSCSVRFYDLMRAPAVCPKCSTAQPPPKPRAYGPPRGGLRGRQPAAVAVAALVVEPDADAPEEEADEEEAAEAVEDDVLDIADDDVAVRD